MDPIFDIDIVRGDDATVVVVVGELDVFTSPALAERLDWAARNGSERVILDLHRVTFIDARGVGVVVQHVLAHPEDGALVLGPMSSAVARVFAVSGIRDLIPTHSAWADHP
jgi:anti-sigma B factor antagonist